MHEGPEALADGIMQIRAVQEWKTFLTGHLPEHLAADDDSGQDNRDGTSRVRLKLSGQAWLANAPAVAGDCSGDVGRAWGGAQIRAALTVARNRGRTVM
jgi:hypothetical protein